MAYIGHSASGNFTTKPSKDTFSGDGSTTAFTLSEGATTNTVDVFVENVRQEPTTAYSVNGTTLTFTEAPGSGTNNIYVVNRGPLQLSATHPAAQALEASTGTFTGDLTVDTNTLHVDSTNNRVGVGTTAPETPIEIETTNKLGDTFTGTVDGEGLRVTQTNYTSGNYVSLVEAPFDDSQTAANVRIGAMFDGGGSHLAFGTSNSFGSGITNTAMFIDQVGFVGVGNTAPDTTLDVSGSGVHFEVYSTNSNTYKVQFKNNGTITSYLGTAADSFFFANASAAQLLRIDSDGVKFGTDSAAANGLADYEEGTWTPAYTGGSSAPTVTHNNQIGRYVKVGQIVSASFRINTNGISGGSGAAFISGLPYASESVSSMFSSLLVGYSASFAGNAPQAGFLAAGGTSIQLLTNSATSSRSQLGSSVAISDLNTASGATYNDVIGHITYRTA